MTNTRRDRKIVSTVRMTAFVFLALVLLAVFMTAFLLVAANSADPAWIQDLFEYVGLMEV